MLLLLAPHPRYMRLGLAHTAVALRHLELGLYEARGECTPLAMQMAL